MSIIIVGVGPAEFDGECTLAQEGEGGHTQVIGNDFIYLRQNLLSHQTTLTWVTGEEFSYIITNNISQNLATESSDFFTLC